jgi:hypothetical protein
MTDWFIEGIDVRGGLAIATQRESDLLNPTTLVDGGASVFIAPPAFVPQYVASRSVGFSLARNRGRPGLFLHDQEVPFDSLAAVTEFVRRSYLRGAGGDGAGENGGSSPPPSPEGGEPREPPEAGLRGIEGGRGAGGDRDPVAALLTIAQENSKTSEDLLVGRSSPGETLWEPTGMPDLRHRRLARGALRVLRELIERQPRGQPAMLHWDMTLEKLLAVLTRMALWPVMLVEFHDKDAVTRWLFGNKNPRGGRLGRYLDSLLSSPWDSWHWAGWPMTSDMFDDLAAFPVPRRAVPFAPRDVESLQALLSAAIATPDELLHPHDFLSEERAELALFGAACLNLSAGFCPWVYGRWIDSDTYFEFGDQLARRAQAWLAGNLPKFVFAMDVEKVIRQASEVPA